jgi:hypothetical protein
VLLIELCADAAGLHKSANPKRLRREAKAARCDIFFIIGSKPEDFIEGKGVVDMFSPGCEIQTAGNNPNNPDGKTAGSSSTTAESKKRVRYDGVARIKSPPNQWFIAYPLKCFPVGWYYLCSSASNKAKWHLSQIR